MAEYIWVGGAATVTGVTTITYTFNSTGWSNADTPDVVMLDEAGTSQTSTHTISGAPADAEAVRDAILVTLQAETQSLFLQVTFASSGTDTITATAKVGGIPSHFNKTLTDADASAGDGVVVLLQDGSSSSVLSEGPEDWNTDGSGNYNSSNWETAQGATTTKPPDGANNVKFNQGAWSARYGLNQGTGVDEIRITQGFTGDIGDPVNGFYLILDIDNASPQALSIDKTEGRVWITCVGANAFIMGLPPGADALKFGAASDLTGVVVSGPGVRGTITCTTGMALDNIVMVDCPACHMAVGGVTSLDRVEVGAGVCELTMAANPVVIRVQVWGSGTVIHNSNHSGGTVALWESYGGRSEYNGQGTLTLLKMYGGLFTLENSTADAVTITTVNQDGGRVVEGGMVNATWSPTYNQNGGTTDAAVSVNKFSQHAV